MRAILAGLALLLPSILLSQTKENLSVYFDTDSDKLNKTAIVLLDSLWRNKPDIPRTIEFELKGYCDNRGSDQYNISLSKKRVATVKNYLLQRGVKMKNILSAAGYGENAPLNENLTEDERQLNRRVDISLVASERLNASTEKDTATLKEKIADPGVKAGSSITLKNINFLGGLPQFRDDSQPSLHELLDAMKTFPTLVIQIEGHICCQPGPDDGINALTGIFNLSEARARAVMEYLVLRGISQDRVTFKGLGHSMPLYPYPEQTEEERIANRRVEIKIISK